MNEGWAVFKPLSPQRTAVGSLSKTLVDLIVAEDERFQPFGCAIFETNGKFDALLLTCSLKLWFGRDFSLFAFS